MAAAPEDSTKAVKRLTKELKKLSAKKLPYAEAKPKSSSDMLHWQAIFKGPAGSPYAGGKFKVDLNFSADYPMKAPEVVFTTKIYHPSVSQEDGKVCPELIEKNWAPVLNIFFVLETINSMLTNPETDSPVEVEVADLMAKDKKKFEETCKKWVKKYAK